MNSGMTDIPEPPIATYLKGHIKQVSKVPFSKEIQFKYENPKDLENELDPLDVNDLDTPICMKDTPQLEAAAYLGGIPIQSSESLKEYLKRRNGYILPFPSSQPPKKDASPSSSSNESLFASIENHSPISNLNSDRFLPSKLTKSPLSNPPLSRSSSSSSTSSLFRDSLQKKKNTSTFVKSTSEQNPDSNSYASMLHSLYSTHSQYRHKIQSVKSEQIEIDFLHTSSDPALIFSNVYSPLSSSKKSQERTYQELKLPDRNQEDSSLYQDAIYHKANYTADTSLISETPDTYKNVTVSDDEKQPARSDTSVIAPSYQIQHLDTHSSISNLIVNASEPNQSRINSATPLRSLTQKDDTSFVTTFPVTTQSRDEDLNTSTTNTTHTYKEPDLNHLNCENAFLFKTEEFQADVKNASNQNYTSGGKQNIQKLYEDPVCNGYLMDHDQEDNNKEVENLLHQYETKHNIKPFEVTGESTFLKKESHQPTEFSEYIMEHALSNSKELSTHTMQFSPSRSESASSSPASYSNLQASLNELKEVIHYPPLPSPNLLPTDEMFGVLPSMYEDESLNYIQESGPSADSAFRYSWEVARQNIELNTTATNDSSQTFVRLLDKFTMCGFDKELLPINDLQSTPDSVLHVYDLLMTHIQKVQGELANLSEENEQNLLFKDRFHLAHQKLNNYFEENQKSLQLQKEYTKQKNQFELLHNRHQESKKTIKEHEATIQLYKTKLKVQESISQKQEVFCKKLQNQLENQLKIASPSEKTLKSDREFHHLKKNNQKLQTLIQEKSQEILDLQVQVKNLQNGRSLVLSESGSNNSSTPNLSYTQDLNPTTQHLSSLTYPELLDYTTSLLQKKSSKASEWGFLNSPRCYSLEGDATVSNVTATNSHRQQRKMVMNQETIQGCEKSLKYDLLSPTNQIIHHFRMLFGPLSLPAIFTKLSFLDQQICSHRVFFKTICEILHLDPSNTSYYQVEKFIKMQLTAVPPKISNEESDVNNAADLIPILNRLGMTSIQELAPFVCSKSKLECADPADHRVMTALKHLMKVQSSGGVLSKLRSILVDVQELHQNLAKQQSAL